MINQFLQGEMENEVRRWVRAGAMFTALDISRAVQATGVRERHQNLKQVVHDLWARGAMGSDYRRTLLRFGGGEAAFLYHRDVDAPRTYDTGSGARWTSAGSVSAHRT